MNKYYEITTHQQVIYDELIKYINKLLIGNRQKQIAIKLVDELVDDLAEDILEADAKYKELMEVCHEIQND